MESDRINALRPRLVAFAYEALPGRRGRKLFRWFSVQHMVDRVAVRTGRVLEGSGCWLVAGRFAMGAGRSVSSPTGGVVSELYLLDSCNGGGAAIDGDDMAVRFGKMKGTSSGAGTGTGGEAGVGVGAGVEAEVVTGAGECIAERMYF